MEKNKVVWDSESADNYSLDLVGGKGYNLLKLADYSRSSGLFVVPKFFMIPPISQEWTDGTKVKYDSLFVEEAFAKLSKPVVVRSSSPLEDGIKASFAGRFLTRKNVDDLEGLYRAINDVKESVFSNFVEQYAEKMDIEMEYHMPVIIQEQVRKDSERIVLQFDEDGAVLESFYGKNGEEVSTHDYSWRELDNLFEDSKLEKYAKSSKEESLFNLPHIGEGQYYYALQVARRAKKIMNLEGTVQVEAFLHGRSLPIFVQIRQLPKLLAVGSCSDISIPDGTPYIESKVCNGIAGEASLPAYVTFSQSGFKRIMIETGQSNLIGLRGEGDERADRFRKESKLATNGDYRDFVNIALAERFEGLQRIMHAYNSVWKRGNKLFPEYVLVCDKLDETIAGMTNLTTNKKAIITCAEASKTSHAMTVARDLGIIAMGIEGDYYDLEPKFFHKIQTGDLVKIKSDGKRAVAYIEKKREADPTIQLESPPEV
jgi:hypothetical protein